MGLQSKARRGYAVLEWAECSPYQSKRRSLRMAASYSPPGSQSALLERKRMGMAAIQPTRLAVTGRVPRVGEFPRSAWFVADAVVTGRQIFARATLPVLRDRTAGEIPEDTGQSRGAGWKSVNLRRACA